MTRVADDVRDAICLDARTMNDQELARRYGLSTRTIIRIRQERGIPSSYRPPTPAERGECAVEGCDKPVNAKGWCQGHYRRWNKYGDVFADQPLQMGRRAKRLDGEPWAGSEGSGGPCRVEGCKNPAHGRGWCAGHYRRWQRFGSVYPNEPLAKGWRPGGPGSSKPCKVDGCERLQHAKGLCGAHYWRSRRDGDVRAGEPVKPPRSRKAQLRVVPLTPTAPDPDGTGWQAAAACRGYPTEWWFPKRGEPLGRALELCDRCPVRDECLAASMGPPREKHGIWGGVSELGRRRLSRRAS